MKVIDPFSIKRVQIGYDPFNWGFWLGLAALVILQACGWTLFISGVTGLLTPHTPPL